MESWTGDSENFPRYLNIFENAVWINLELVDENVLTNQKRWSFDDVSKAEKKRMTMEE